MYLEVLKQLAIAAGLGLLVGLQRQRAAASRIAGVRTFPMITVFGAISALLAQQFGAWVLAATALSLAGLVIAGSVLKARASNYAGLTTEIAMLLMFGVGAYLVGGSEEVAIAVGAGVAVLLQFKGQLHGLAARLGDDDLKAIMQFALISLVILPVLPNQAYGPYSVLNPHQIWLMVVLIVGINLGGYIVYKFFGQRAGTVTGGIIGGVISSTATTVSYSRRTRTDPQVFRAAAVVIVISSTVVFARVLLEIGVVARDFLAVALMPIALMLLLFAVISAAVWRWGQRGQSELPLHQNPTELRSALLFGFIFAVVLFAVAATKAHFGGKGLYLVAGLSGLTDVDAITLSTSQLVKSGRIEAADGWRLILLALMSNLVFKWLVVAALGSRQLLSKVALVYGVAVATGAGVLLLWR